MYKNDKKSIFAQQKKFKTTKNAIFGLFSGAKIDFLPFLKVQIMCFCTFEIALFPILEHRVRLDMPFLARWQDGSHTANAKDSEVIKKVRRVWDNQLKN